ncbi:glycosyltransferase family 2 protein [Ammoniphilus resinae]|nr:glycosyltransferase family 2 protein [Ammoniphilus resinae]
MKPLVSILIPTCNRPVFFEKALKSALNQTYQNTEIIICDNSDNDKTENIVKKYQAGRGGSKIRYVRNKENIGPIANQHKCFRLAKGQYINYLMDDDVFHPEKIARMMNYYLKYKGITLVTSRRRVIDVNGKLLNVPKKYKTFKILYPRDTIVEGKELGNRMLRDNTNYIGEPTTVLFRKKDLDEPLGMMNGRQALFAVDFVSWLNLLSKGNAVYVTKTLSYLRYHPDQLSQSAGAKILSILDAPNILDYAKAKGFLKEKSKKKRKKGKSS